MGNFLKKAFADIKQSARNQHQVDKANFEAVKAESRAQWEEAKAQSRPTARKAAEEARREEQIDQAQARTAAARERIDAAKNAQGK